VPDDRPLATARREPPLGRPTALLSGATPTPGSTPAGSAPEGVVAGLSSLLVAAAFVLAVGGALAGSLLAVAAEHALDLPDRRVTLALPARRTVLVDAGLSGLVGANLFVLGVASSELTPFLAIQAPVVGFAGLLLWMRADAA